MVSDTTIVRATKNLEVAGNLCELEGEWNKVDTQNSVIV